mmetsp:Transcript_107908/g.305214  ORF Transcript_107908/g.305214 Transcript_107908/m.305214 type:complete len:293 (-) Transcript_107908:147-1025(-)|eukprot:CAMPEP_0168421722 /NCGR_PEP_ID=MMETSP0228-20121227/33426_1 /TAXON_ID=133427 /ORGANISM="Protoceratium reticulatum, Strain CCCM 535 (=CCMP 1889)" /LENGTH=292 /DNA_ID=CAMNT_0008435635 /DNA_START=64 /DNA_END=942 /DNA_ORIENTATION=-
MSSQIDPTNLTIIYAEDELVFQEISLASIAKAGVAKENIYAAEDGSGALEHLKKVQDDNSAPLLMLLDVRMPGMDGNQCARKVQELLAAGGLRREPFMVCCSAGNREVSFTDPEGLFHVVLPKPFGKKEVDLCIEHASIWWGTKTRAAGAAVSGTPVASSDGPASRQASDPGQVDIIVADDEPVCRMAIEATLTLVGVDQAHVTEVEDDDEFREALDAAQAVDSPRPLLILLGSPGWISMVTERQSKRKPFIVCTSAERAPDGLFHASLPLQFSQADFKDILQKCCSWFDSS